MIRIHIASPESLPQAAAQLLALGHNKKVYAISGTMGAGKTTLIKAMCQLLQVTDPVSSPTFAIINEYRTRETGLVYHFDFYRIQDTREAFDFGYEDYFYSPNYCFIEWPERIADLLPPEHISVHIQILGDTERMLEIHS